MSNAAQYNSPVATITIGEDGVYTFNLKDTYEPYNENEAKKQFEFFNNYSMGKAYKVFVDTSKSVNLPDEKAIIYFRKHNKPEYRFAVLAINLPIKIFIGQLLKYNGFKNMRLFKTIEEAMKWLLEDKQLKNN